MAQLDTIKFSKNWNNKLNCQYFTTFRLVSNKYQLNKTYRIEFNDKYLGLATIRELRSTTLSKINDFISLLDACMEAPKFVNMIKNMYKNKGVDPVRQQYYFILLRWDKREQISIENEYKGETKINKPTISIAKDRLPGL